MDPPASPRDSLRRLHATLDRLLRRMTRRLHGSPREMQMDAAAAIALLPQVEVPNRAYLASTLGNLVRELGQRRPDLLRYVVTLEGSLAQVAELLAAGAEEPGEAGAPPGP
ncbi:MAG TPA: hypothetical protein VHG51_18040 [Longimicrobiaceae bacterium]|nr:hypothetical protein [Longimicrobiaceae bacterium]